MASTDATFVPVKNQAYRVTFPILDSTGALVAGATGLDSEVSKDQGTFADCTNEATQIAASSGMYYLDLTATEMNADTVAIIVKSTEGKTVPLVLYPQEAGSELAVNVTHIAGAAVSASTAQLGVNVVNWKGSAAATVDTAGYPVVTVKSGAGSGEISLSSGQVSISSSGVNAIADQVWDEAAAGHVSAGSFGQANNFIRAATAQAGASTTITLDASASAVNDFYNNQRIFITGGTGAGQGRIIEDYVGSTKVATVASWAVNPSSDSVFVILPFGSIPGASAPTAAEVADAVWDEAMAGHVAAGSFGQAAIVLRAGTAQAGGASSITLDSGASATDDLFNYQIVQIVGGTGAGQARQITDYVGSTKVATVGLAWAVNPDATSVFLIKPLGIDAATVATIADAVWDEARSGHVTAGTFGEFTFSDVVRLSGDATAADNAEAFFDGTGYAGTNNVIPSVTTVTGNVNGSVASVTGNVGGSVATVTALAANSVNASALATDAVTEIQAGLATAAALSTAQSDLTTIKGKTNSLTFTVANKVDANTKSINDVTVNGDGSGTPWGP